MTERRVRIVLDSKTAEKNAKNFESSMVGAGAASDKTAFSVNKLAGAIAGLMTIQKVTGFVNDSIKTFAGFEQSMARVRAITRATDEQLAIMSETARELGATTEFTASQAAQGLQFLGMAGFNAADSVAAIPSVLNLATAASLDLGRAADITSNIMSAFSIAAEDTSEVTDVLSATASRANTDIEQLGHAMSFVGPVSQSLGISINDTAAAVGSLSDAGIQGGRAGTSLRRVLTSLLNPTGKAAATIEGLGLSLEELNPQANSITDIIGRLRGAAIDGSQAMEIFGDRGGPALLALVEQYPRLVELTGGLQDVTGESQRMADTMRDTLTGDIKTLESAFQDLQITMVSTFDDELRDKVQSTTNLIRILSDNMETIGTVIEYLSVVIGTRLAVALGFATVAFAKKSIAAVQATTTVNAYGMVVSRTTMLQNTLNASLRVGSGLLRLMGGPIGLIAITAASLLVYRNNMQDAADATDELSINVDNLGRAEARASLMRLTDLMEAQEEKMQNAALAINMYRDQLNRVAEGSEEFDRINKQVIRHEAIAEQLGKTMLKTADRAKILREMLANEYMVQDPFELTESQRNYQSPNNADDSTNSVQGEGGNKELEEMQLGTEELQRQLNARLQISQMYRNANLESIKNSFELEREENRIQEEERKINMDADFETEKSKRQLRFEEKMNELEASHQVEKELRNEFEEQERLRLAIHEESKTAIEEKAAQDRAKITQQETNAKIGAYQSLASSGLAILQAFGSDSVKSQKAFAVIESGIAITAGVAKALNNTYPANLGYAAQVAAQGAGLISKLKSIGTSKNSSVSAPSAISAGGSANSDLGRSQMSDTSAAQNDRVLRVSGVNDDSVLMGRTFKEMMKVLEDGGGFGRIIYGS